MSFLCKDSLPTRRKHEKDSGQFLLGWYLYHKTTIKADPLICSELHEYQWKWLLHLKTFVTRESYIPQNRKKTPPVWEWIMNRNYKTSREILIENTWYFLIKILDGGILCQTKPNIYVKAWENEDLVSNQCPISFCQMCYKIKLKTDYVRQPKTGL